MALLLWTYSITSSARASNEGGAPLFVEQTRIAANAFGIRLQQVSVNGPEDFEHAFSDMVRDRADAVIVQPIFLQVGNHTRLIADLATRNRLPSISDYVGEFVTQGGLMSYGASREDLYRRAATYVDRILKGASPGELPIELPTRFEFGINLKTAKALGLTVLPDRPGVPETLLDLCPVIVPEVSRPVWEQARW
jgi:putative ABC transport system substrate-binding protein